MSDTVEFTREDFRAGILDAIVVMVNRNRGLHTDRYKNLRFRVFIILGGDPPTGLSIKMMDKKAATITLDDFMRLPDNSLIDVFEYATYLSYLQR